MSIWQSTFSTLTTRLHITRFRFILLLIVIGLTYAYFTSPLTHLAAARAQWERQGIHHYRIAAKYEIPFYDCQQDLEVRGETITYHHKDTCGGSTSPFTPLIVSNLFKRIEENALNPTCGPNGCACDVPIGIDVIYDPERGYPQQLAYRAMPELRWQYLEYWQAQLSGTPTCPMSAKNALPSSGETITVLSLKPLKSEAGIGTLPFATAEPP